MYPRRKEFNQIQNNYIYYNDYISGSRKRNGSLKRAPGLHKWTSSLVSFMKWREPDDIGSIDSDDEESIMVKTIVIGFLPIYEGNAREGPLM